MVFSSFTGIIVQKQAYFRSIWNIIEFIIVLTGYLSLIQINQISVVYMRLFRIFRPLKSITKIQGLKKITNSLIGSFTYIIDTIIILLFFICISSIFALVLFHGGFKNRCIQLQTGKGFNINQTCGILRTCQQGYICGRMIKNPLNQLQNYDTIFWSMINIFQIITIEGITSQLFNMQNTFNIYVGFIYMMLIILLGAYMIINLIVGVLKAKFNLNIQNQQRSKQIISFTSFKNIYSNYLLQKMIQKSNIRNMNFQQQYGSNFFRVKEFFNEVIKTSLVKKISRKKKKYTIPQIRKPQKKNKSKISHTIKINQISFKEYKIINKGQKNSNFQFKKITKPQQVLNELVYQSFYDVKQYTLKNINLKQNRQIIIRYKSNFHYLKIPIAKQMTDDNLKKKKNSIYNTKIFAEQKQFDFVMNTYFSDSLIQIKKEENQYYDPQKYQIINKQVNNSFFNTIQYHVNDLTFEKLITIIIALNLINIIFFENLLITQLFVFIYLTECILKIFANKTNYFKKIQNIFDLVVTIVSLVELFYSNGVSLSTIRTIRILRIFRTIRMTKLAKYFQQINLIIKIIHYTLQQFLQLLLLIPIFIVVYSILGNQIYAGKLNNIDIRQNFDSIFYSFQFLFQLMTSQNWHIILSQLLNINIYKITSILFIISWIIWSHYVLLNLFIAILLQGFSRQVNFQNKQYLTNINLISNQQNTLQFDQGQCQYSLNLFSQQNYIRKTIKRILKSKIYQRIIYGMMIFTGIYIIFDSYLYIQQNNQTVNIFKQMQILNKVSHIINYIITSFFVLQFILNIISKGLFMQPLTYLRSLLGILQFGINIISLVQILIINFNFYAIKIIRMIRLLKVLRVLKTSQINIMIKALWYSLSGISNILCLIGFILLIYSIIGNNIFSNNLHYCKHDNIYLNQEECYSQGGIWSNYQLHFDNIAYGMISLFVILTKDFWWQSYYFWIDSNNNFLKKNNNLIFTIIFMVSFLLICAYFLINLFGGLIHLYYSQLISRSKKYSFLNMQQQNWIRLKKLIQKNEIDFSFQITPSNKIRKIFFYLQTNFYYLWIIRFLKLGNIIVLSLTQDDVDRSLLLNITYYTMTVVFGFQIFAKMLAFDMIVYIKQRWNQLDIIIFILSIIDISFYINNGKSIFSQSTQIASAFKVFRLLRTFKMFKKLFKGLQKLIDTIVHSLINLLNAIGLLFFSLMIFSIIAVNLFENLKYKFINSLSQQLKFDSFHMAFMSLFLISNGQQWSKIMIKSLGFQCVEQRCGSPYYLIYWILFIFINNFILFQIFVLILLYAFQQFYINQNNPLTIIEYLQNDFKASFVRYVKKRQGLFVEKQRILRICLDMAKPLGAQIKTQLQEFSKIISHLDHTIFYQKIFKLQKKITYIILKNLYNTNLTLINNKIHYKTLFYQLSKICYYNRTITNCDNQQQMFLENSNNITEQNIYQQIVKKQKNKQSETQITIYNPYRQYILMKIFFYCWNRQSNILFEKQNKISNIMFQEKLQIFKDCQQGSQSYKPFSIQQKI